MRTETQLEFRWFQPTGREVSRDGYKWAIRSGTVTPQRARILSELAAHNRPLTRHEIADACSAQPNAPKMEVSSVCGRVHELLDSGQIAVVGIQSRKAAPSRQQLGLTPTGWSLFEATGAA